jgi:hypothetical protein
MKRKLPYLFFILFFGACSPKVSYVGNSYPATQSVEVFVVESAITKPYAVIGRGYPVHAVARRSSRVPEKMMNQAVKKAKKIGADAVFFYNYYILRDGTFIQTSSVFQQDTVRRVTTARSNTSIVNNVVTQKQEILFLKYK